MMPYREVPIFVNSFNRLTCLERLIKWLHAAGHRRIFVVDNASTYPPLLDYLDNIERSRIATVIRLPANVGHLAIWACGLLDRLGITSEYVYTDPDVVPADFCPPNAVEFLQEISRESRDSRRGTGHEARRHSPSLPAQGCGIGVGASILAEAGRAGRVPRRDRYDLCALPPWNWPHRRWPLDPHGLAVPRRARRLVYRPPAPHGRRCVLPALGQGWDFALVSDRNARSLTGRGRPQRSPPAAGCSAR